ncbi:MAG: hypothetical protein Q9160_009282 [Pyrenula sp. 1 TL-2023]
MKHSVIDPRVYGDDIRSARQDSNGDDGGNKNQGDKISGTASRNIPPTEPSSVSSAAPCIPSSARPNPVQPVEEDRNEGVHGTLISSPTTASTSSPVDVPRPPKRRLASTNQQEQIEEREQRSEQKRKRIRRENIARIVGHEVDSDGEREYFRACRDRDVAEVARRKALSPEARTKEDIERSEEALRRHIKPQLTFHYSGLAKLCHYPLFLLQTVLDARNATACRLFHCTDRIIPGQYRIALSPGNWGARSPDYYHVKCFEELLDLTSPHYMARFEADSQKYVPDHGVQCILEEYISRWRLRIKRTGEHEDTQFTSSSVDALAESSSGKARSRMSNDNNNTAEQQVTSQRRNTEIEAPDRTHVASNQSLAQSQLVSGSGLHSLSTSKQTVEPDVWTVADDIWAEGRKVEAEAFKEHRKLHCEFSFQICRQT